ncbi:MAG: carboxypeptidase-like regulatory domain-containing protein [Cyclobacteriaceae bacterium]|nr:carboxypeptidase-like regulatory domain-containing protein [Cyclobacteriaceae bacterium]
MTSKTLLFLFLTLLLYLAHYDVSAQQITVSGILIDYETEEPLSFASVGIKGATFGTITNQSGEFDFHINGNMLDKVLIVSMLGYENFETKISEIDYSKSIVIRLKKIPQVLEEVTIQDSLTGSNIIEIVINRMVVNYPDKPFLVEGFYRDIKRVNNSYISLLESAIQIFDNNHEPPRNPFKLREKVGLLQVRKSLGYNHKYIEYFDQGNLLENLLLNNTIRYYDFPDISNANAYTRVGISTIDNKEVYIILSRKKGVKIKFFVDVKNYAIVRLEYESDNDENILNVNDRYKDYFNRFVRIVKTIEYKYYEGKYYLNYMTMYKRNQWYHRENKTLDYDVELYQELLINDIHPSTSKRIKTKNRMKKYGLQYQDQPYEPEFWKNYNVIKRTQLDDKIIEDLERDGNLEQQFEGY